MKQTVLIFILFISLSTFLEKRVHAQSLPVGKIYNITDEQINGFAYDPACPTTPVEVHVWHEDTWSNGAARPTVCHAKHACVWPGICADSNGNGTLGDDGKGFWCTPRHPLNSHFVTDPNKLNHKIAIVSKCRPNTVTWLDTENQNPPVIKTVVQNRENDTIFVDKPFYRIGVSKRFGGAIVEYYNKNGTGNDAAINLIKPAAGEALQTTVFGKYPVGPGNDCFGANGTSGFGIQGPVYNPTQTGSYCGIPNPSQVEACFANDQPTDCQRLLTTTAQKIGFQTHYRNFTYPMQSNETLYRQYQPYDDVWGKIDYTFTDNFIRIDYDTWKTGNTTYGSGIQQFPIAFLNHITKFIYQESGTIKTMSPNLSAVIKYPVQNNSDGRWFTGISVPFTARNGEIITPEPQNAFLTMAMYSGKVNNSCPTRFMQINNVPFGFGNTYLSQLETTTVTAQNYLELELKPGNHIRARAYIFPYHHTDTLPGTSSILSSLLSQSETTGGFVPTWECNYIPPTVSPTLPSNTSGDLNADGRANIFDYNLLVADFGKTGSVGFIPADIDKNGKVDIFDYNILVKIFGKIQ